MHVFALLSNFSQTLNDAHTESWDQLYILHENDHDLEIALEG